MNAPSQTCTKFRVQMQEIQLWVDPRCLLGAGRANNIGQERNLFGAWRLELSVWHQVAFRKLTRSPQTCNDCALRGHKAVH